MPKLKQLPNKPQVETTPPSLDVWVEADVYFPPKKTRHSIGRVVRRERAEFRTAFANELVEI